LSRAPRRPMVRKKKPSKKEIRSYIEEAYDVRQTEWGLELFDKCNEIDWNYLLGLHLEMVELEYLLNRTEDLPND
jgi:hypothetical protein